MSQSRKVTRPNTVNMEKEALQAMVRKDEDATFWPEEVLHLIDYVYYLERELEQHKKATEWLEAYSKAKVVLFGRE